MERKRLTENSWLDKTTLPENLLPNNEQFLEMWNFHPTERHKVKIYGEMKEIPRFQQAYLRDYSFSGSESKSLPLPDIFKPYLEWMNSFDYGEFNQFLVNWYQNGENYIGSHADDERQLISDSPIVSITICLGGTFDELGNFNFNDNHNIPRKFRIRDKNKKIIEDVETTNGLVLVMGGKFQKEFKHEIVKISGKKANLTGPRISITLRQFI